MRSRVYIAVNGIGLGHARRSLRIGSKLRESTDVVFSTYRNTPAADYLKRKGMKVIELQELSWAQADDGGLDVPKTLLKTPFGAGVSIYHLLAEYYLDRKINPKVIISDMRAAPIMVSKQLNIPCFMLGLFFNLKREVDSFFMRQPVRLLGGFLKKLAKSCVKTFITDFPLPYTIYRRVLPDTLPKNFVFTGPIINKGLERAIQDRDVEEVKNESKEKLGISNNQRVILFIPSGVKKSRGKFFMDFMSMISEFKEMRNVKFIFSRAMPELPMRRYRIRNIEVWNWIPDLTNYLLAADIIVGYYGMNKVFDAIASGSIFLGFVAKNQIEQKALAQRIVELGLGLILNDLQMDLIKAINIVLSDEKYRRNVLFFAEKAKQYRPIETIIKYVAPFLE